ncbi:MAG: hypothetical protein K2X39_01430 [Silvanigrellaceae bacterium]|nr:hypothetical protein [Silvanigrellaceae bacterium]
MNLTEKTNSENIYPFFYSFGENLAQLWCFQVTPRLKQLEHYYDSEIEMLKSVTRKTKQFILEAIEKQGDKIEKIKQELEGLKEEYANVLMRMKENTFGSEHLLEISRIKAMEYFFYFKLFLKEVVFLFKLVKFKNMIAKIL